MLEEVKTTFPTLVGSQWWSLRDKFRRGGVPPMVNVSYLTTALNISERSAEIFIVGLKSLHLIDADGKPQDRAERWRHDDTYAAVCEEIRKEVYPEELFHAVPDPSQDRAAAERWFARKTKASAKHVQKMVALFVLLCQADPAADPSARKTRSSTSSVARKNASPGMAARQKTEPTTKAPLVSDGNGVTAIEREQVASSASSANPLPAPAIHLDIQIHIDPSASADQIDQIFSSMARHLKSWYNPEAR